MPAMFRRLRRRRDRFWLGRMGGQATPRAARRGAPRQYFDKMRRFGDADAAGGAGALTPAAYDISARPAEEAWR